jgi:hypothetical protein
LSGPFFPARSALFLLNDFSSFPLEQFQWRNLRQDYLVFSEP